MHGVCGEGAFEAGAGSQAGSGVSEKAIQKLEAAAWDAAAVLAVVAKDSRLSKGARDKAGRVADKLLEALDGIPAPDAAEAKQRLRDVGLGPLADRLDALE